MSIAYSEEGEPPLETAGGIVHALPLLGLEPFVLVNSDVFTDFDFGVLVNGPRRAMLVLVPNPAHNPRGDFGLDAAGFVSPTPPLLTYAGIAVFDPRSFVGFAPGRRPLKPLLDAAIARRDLKGPVVLGAVARRRHAAAARRSPPRRRPAMNRDLRCR